MFKNTCIWIISLCRNQFIKNNVENIYKIKYQSKIKYWFQYNFDFEILAIILSFAKIVYIIKFDLAKFNLKINQKTEILLYILITPIYEYTSLRVHNYSKKRVYEVKSF